MRLWTLRIVCMLNSDPGCSKAFISRYCPWNCNRGILRSCGKCDIPVIYKGVRIEAGFRADLIVEEKVIVEIKSVELVAPVHKKQLLTYLRLSNKRLGLLINFNVALIKDGITRIVNDLPE